MAALVLSAKVRPRNGMGKAILRLTTNPNAEFPENLAFLASGAHETSSDRFPLVFCIGATAPGAIELPSHFDYLKDGDIVRYSGDSGHLRILYRKNSRHNVLFMTEQCNSRCVMCSQPPRDSDDSYLIDEILQSIPLMHRDTPHLCITGGEPTLNFGGLLQVISAVKEHLPNTPLHMLSNGRAFEKGELTRRLIAIKHPGFTIGIPLYSDQPSHHDFVVQSKGAFDQTILGLLNLARFGQKIEIRFVIHRLTVSRMAATARFIARNLPFASHVALMGFEPTGFGRTNLKGLWIDPWDYRNELTEAVEILRNAGLRTSIYNHQLCILPQPLWPFAQQSISDWKNIYMEECQGVP